MTALTLPILFALLQSPAPQAAARVPEEDPRAVVRAAALAMRGDSAASVAARRSARQQRDTSDRAAALGVATLARHP
ncbi:MAG: hypothetical protein HOQ12_00070, partial [Gemmatimonadaceae bacterium]|nr:hypothetical protein [Gemmatimonadaceae bacterium]